MFCVSPTLVGTRWRRLFSRLLDANGNPVERSASNAAASKSEYDAAGRLARVSAPAASVGYEYDANARLVRESHTAAGATRDIRYSYDAAGNRTSRAVSTAAGTQVTSYSYDAADRLTQESTSLGAGGASATSYEWDGNGNLAARLEAGRATLYRWDAQDRLIDIRTGATPAEAALAAPAVSYAYDAAGNRVKKSVKTASGAAASTSYLVDGTHGYAQVALETTSAGGASAQTQSTAYVWGAQLIRQTRGTAGTLYASAEASSDLFPLAGHLGTSLGALDANGSVAEQVSTEAFGDLAQAGDLKQSHLYTGEYWDQDSGLVYLRARWYDPKVGRFISADPFEGRQADPRSLNRYAYANNDPTHKIDPTGLSTDLAQFGRDVEEEITRQYQRAFPFNRTAFGKHFPYGSGSSYWKPDIQDFSLKTYQEIKPLSVSGVAKGISQMAAYDLAYQSQGWSQGVFVPSFATVDGTPVFFFTTNGIIFYTDDKVLAQSSSMIALASLGFFVRNSVFKLSTKIISNVAIAGANIVARSIAGLTGSILNNLVYTRF